jgi:hypothetical protein
LLEIQTMPRLPILLLLCLLPGCIQPTLRPRNLDELQPPGFIDVGAGYAVAFDTRATSNDDADGLLISLKAYPFGRWYAKPRSNSSQALANASRVLIEKKLEQGPAAEMSSVTEARRHVAMALSKLRDQTVTDLEGRIRDCKQCVTRASTQLRAIPDGNQAWLENVLEDLETADAALDDSQEGASAASLASAEQVLEDRRAELARAEAEITRAIARLGEAQGDLLNEEFYEVQTDPEGDSTLSRIARRFSVFYGTSVNDFGGGGLESNVNAVGLAFDVAPQLSILVGYGFYQVDTGGGVDTDGGLVASVSLNLNAFRWMFGGLSN